MSNLAHIQLPILIYTLDRMAEQSDLALQGAMEFNEQKTRDAVDALRQLKSQLSQITPDARALVDGSAVTDSQRQALADKIRRIEQADGFLPIWCRRYEQLHDDATLYQSLEGCHNLIDAFVPLVWDWATDLLVIHGELNEQMKKALSERGQKRVLTMTSESFNQDLLEAESYFSTLPSICERMVLFESPSLKKRLAPEEKEEFEQTFAKHASVAFTGLTTVKTLASQWLQQGLKNLPQIAKSPSLIKLHNVFKDKPLVIVSPGPSLDKNIDQLKALKGKAIILAAVQSAKALSSHGITADLMMVIDPKDFSYVLDGADISGVEALIAGVTCNENFVLQPFKQVIFCNVNNELDAWATDIFGDTAIYGGGGSVSVSALRLALYTGASPIALVGQDLALTDGKVYSNQSVLGGVHVEIDEKTGSFSYKNCTEDFFRTGQEQGEDRKNGRAQLFKLPGYFGGEVNTRTDFYAFHQEFVGIAKGLKKERSAVQLYNCTEGGAFIEGFEHVPLKDWIFKLQATEPLSVAEMLLHSFESMEWATREKRLIHQTKHMKIQLREANRLARECRTELKGFEQKPLTESQIKKINKLEKKLIQAVKTIPFISMLMQEHLNSQVLRDEIIKNSEGHNMAALSLYQLVIDGCERCLGFLE
jgi:hypothetical protein